MNIERYTERSRGFVQAAQSLALREGHQQFAPEHLLKVLLDDSEGLAAGLIDRSGGASRQILAATEARIDAKMTQLKALQTQISALLGQRDAAQEKQLASLVKTYSAMKPKDAARIFDSLNDQVLVPVAAEMKSDVLAPVLAAMSPEQAQKLTIRLANKLTLPETNSISPAAAPSAGLPVGPVPAGVTSSVPAAPAPAAPKTGG